MAAVVAVRTVVVIVGAAVVTVGTAVVTVGAAVADARVRTTVAHQGLVMAQNVDRMLKRKEIIQDKIWQNIKT